MEPEMDTEEEPEPCPPLLRLPAREEDTLREGLGLRLPVSLGD